MVLKKNWNITTNTMIYAKSFMGIPMLGLTGKQNFRYHFKAVNKILS